MILLYSFIVIAFAAGSFYAGVVIGSKNQNVNHQVEEMQRYIAELEEKLGEQK